ncbi:hypothetical protein MXD62_15150 [Frankia sp. Mgl5]|uniref:hypothetical protein n=1 Tax=Frankia sp. Mgl5 TaxID=2933793 RepID=UPI00200F79F4|nr:hypothetical protein [Frankia sp. Mgl5]MCK9928493.1 hypothetical protein [Frankia sp. Mgl5]
MGGGTAGLDGGRRALTAFAALVAGLWTYRAVTDGADGPWVRAARDYAAWRVGVAVG